MPDIRTIAAVVLMLSAAGNYLMFNLWQGSKDDLTAYRASVAQAQKQAEADAEKQRVEQQRILADTARGWADAVDWHRAHPRVVRVLQPAGCVSEGGTVPAPLGEPDARPAEHGSGSIELTAEQCEARINAAVLDAAQVVWLRDFIQQQHEASK